MPISKLFKSTNSALAGFSHHQFLSNNQMLPDVKHIGDAMKSFGLTNNLLFFSHYKRHDPFRNKSQ
jgi:hypothetical protein